MSVHEVVRKVGSWVGGVGAVLDAGNVAWKTVQYFGNPASRTGEISLNVSAGEVGLFILLTVLWLAAAPRSEGYGDGDSGDDGGEIFPK